jgi:aryl-alcohol dehydrogenase-like predicted oxidoreductase
MKTRKLGRTDIAVSEICLGTMTWGSQNSVEEAHRQIDLALSEGVNFMDTAEMYPTTPRKKETVGLTEEIIGQWIAANPGKRGEVVLATKISGAGNAYLRGGARVNGAYLREALEQSLVRLQTDYVDLYQLHWPNRGSYSFRQHWNFDPTRQDVGCMTGEVTDMLGEVQRLCGEGKLRHFGLSNETAWGMTRFAAIADGAGLPRPVSVQNEYGLLCRLFDTDAGEVAVREDIGLLAYSPLSAGILSGKYLDGDVPSGSRLALQPDLYGRMNPISREATRAYYDVAAKHGILLNQMALAFCLTRPFLTSAIVGATTEAQLQSNIAAAKLTLSPEVTSDIAAVHRRYPMPT